MIERLRRVGIACGVACVVSCGTASSVYAADQADSQLRQAIVAADCTQTSVSTGVGVSSVLGCPEPPTIASVTLPEGSTGVLSGWYDSTNSVAFQVAFQGVTYVLDVDPELTAQGDTWQLNIPGVLATLAPGMYGVSAQSQMNDGQTLISSSAVTIVDKEDSGEEGDDGGANEGGDTGVTAPNTGFMRKFMDYAADTAMFAVVLVAVIVGLGMVGYFQKANRKK